MAWVKLKEDYGKNRAGEVVRFPASVARSLIHQRKALGGNLNEKAAKPKTGKREVATPSKKRKK